MKKIIIPLICFAQMTFAQTGLWMNAGLGKKWSKLQRSQFDIGYRQNLGLGFDRIYLDASHQVSIYDGISIQGAYRLALNEKGDQIRLRTDLLSHRVQIGFKISVLDLLDLGPKRLTLNWASIQQWGMQANQTTSSIWRNKLSIAYDLKNFPLSPCLSAEHFYRWNASVVYTPNDVIVTGATTQWRYFFGAAVELPKNQELKLQFGLRNRANGTQSLARISYSYQF
ncbi:MAG: hypothetical protein RLZZ65_447 [Bacteroidota bacterium]|jgi:hypothetical protein